MSSEETTGGLRERIIYALNSAVESIGDEDHDRAVMGEDRHHDGHNFYWLCYVCRGDVAALADAVIAVALAGKAVVDLPEPDDHLQRLSGREPGFRVGGWRVRASQIDEPTVSMEMGDYLAGGYSFPARQARLIAAAILAAADAAERPFVPGEVRNGQ